MFKTVGFWDFPFPSTSKTFFQNNSFEVFDYYYPDYKGYIVKDMFLQMIDLEILNDEQFITIFKILKIYDIDPLDYPDTYTLYGLDNKRKFLRKYPFDPARYELSKEEKEYKNILSDYYRNLTLKIEDLSYNPIKPWNKKNPNYDKSIKKYESKQIKIKKAIEDFKKNFVYPPEENFSVENKINIINLSRELYYSEDWSINFLIYPLLKKNNNIKTMGIEISYLLNNVCIANTYSEFVDENDDGDDDGDDDDEEDDRDDDDEEDDDGDENDDGDYDDDDDDGDKNDDWGVYKVNHFKILLEDIKKFIISPKSSKTFIDKDEIIKKYVKNGEPLYNLKKEEVLSKYIDEYDNFINLKYSNINTFYRLKSISSKDKNSEDNSNGGYEIEIDITDFNIKSIYNNFVDIKIDFLDKLYRN